MKIESIIENTEEIGAFLVIAIILFIFSRYYFKKIKNLQLSGTISKREYRHIIFLTLTYFEVEGLQIVFNVFRLNFHFRDLVLLPLAYIAHIIPVYVAWLICYRKFVNPLNSVKPNGEIEELKVAVNKVFNSNEFYNALSSVLPKGKGDKEYGLDYIPYMLQNLQEKRKRFQKSSNNFLVATICISVFFVIVTIFFSYILLNESSIGIYKEVDNLNSEIKNSNILLSSIKRDLSEDDYFLRNHAVSLDKLQSTYEYKLDNKSQPFAYKVQEVIDNFELNGNVEQLYTGLKAYRDTLNNIGVSNNNHYFDLLNSTTKEIGDFLNFRDKAFSELEGNIVEISSLVPKIQDNLNKPINSNSELIKRLILSAVVVTFFLTIISYFKGLYQSHYNEMLKAEQNDLLIRKFYVTFKSSENNKDERKIVLSSFLSDSANNVNDLGKDELRTQGNKLENDVLKDMLNAFLKKL